MAKSMTQIKDNTGKIISEIATLSKYFRQESETLTMVAAQVKQLTPEAKTELAIGAAKELGWTVETVAQA